MKKVRNVRILISNIDIGLEKFSNLLSFPSILSNLSSLDILSLDYAVLTHDDAHDAQDTLSRENTMICLRQSQRLGRSQL